MRNLIKKPIVLVGMMGSGKSTIGKRLAYKLNLQFYDSDKIIEEREGLSVVDIYDYRGEEYFKQQELKVIKEIIDYGTIVLSTGGGSFLIDELRDLIKQKAISVWLNADIDTIHDRVSRRNTRPLLNTLDKLETIKKMVDESTKFYEKADITIDCRNMDTHFVVDTIINKLKNFLQ